MGLAPSLKSSPAQVAPSPSPAVAQVRAPAGRRGTLTWAPSCAEPEASSSSSRRSARGPGCRISPEGTSLPGREPRCPRLPTVSRRCRGCPANAQCVQPTRTGRWERGRPPGRGAQLSRCAPPGAPAATGARGPAVGAREGGAGPQAGKEEGPPGQECAWSAPSPSRRRRDARTWPVGRVQGPGEGGGVRTEREHEARPGRARPPDRPLPGGETAADGPPPPLHAQCDSHPVLSSPQPRANTVLRRRVASRWASETRQEADQVLRLRRLESYCWGSGPPCSGTRNLLSPDTQTEGDTV